MAGQPADGATLEALEGALGETGAPPRRNGELVFDAPWQSRAFAMATLLHRQGKLSWDEFALHLSRDTTEEYYVRWLSALTGLLEEGEIVSTREIEGRAVKLAAQDDHGHEH